MNRIRAREIAIVFQEPMTSLNPVYTIGDQIGEVIALHEGLSRRAVLERTIEMLALVQIPNPKRRVNDYPHQFSGGMRQRVMIAMALSCRPKLLIADEPTTALDVTIQAQILDLLQDMKSRFGMSIMLITHAMGVVAEVAQRVVVMYAGKVVEEAPVGQLFANPRHPYTQGLIRSIPRIDKAAVRKTRLQTIAGVVPRLINPPPGCRFAPRCNFATDECRLAQPELARDRTGTQGRVHPCGSDRPMSEPSMHEPLLRVSNLTKQFPLKGGLFGRQAGSVHAVDGVDFQVGHGETLGLVGESGCGKSTTGRCVLRLIEPTSGEIHFEGKNVRSLEADALRILRRDIQIIFQDPYASLNPRMNVGAIVGEALIIHRLTKTRRQFEERVVELLETVGLQADHMGRYPNEFSGGQRQRIGIARALAVEPKLIICDEPVSALDVSIQAQVINLLEDLQQKFGLAYLFIAHDLSVVEHISERVAVMYLGRIVETASARELYTSPRHPYTEALLSAVPIPDPKVKRQRIRLAGEVPSPIAPPTGCHFHTRCPIAQFPRCSTEPPPLKQSAQGHWVACHFR